MRGGVSASAINSDAGVQGLPCDGVCKQGKPCTPGVISNTDQFVCITFIRTWVYAEMRITVFDMPCAAKFVKILT